jgi:hypothetical protein
LLIARRHFLEIVTIIRKERDMFKKVLLYTAAFSFILVSSTAIADTGEIDKGPETILLETVKDKANKPKPSLFPHFKHQETFACGECHHSGTAGKQTPYVEGMKIEKCESCHYKGSGMPSKKDKAKNIAKLDTYKDAAHQNCKTCHKKIKAEKPELKKKWKKCLPCHVKKN